MSPQSHQCFLLLPQHPSPVPWVVTVFSHRPETGFIRRQATFFLRPPSSPG
jgi:hypothetical protein